MSMQDEKTPSGRVADVLKSGLERQLLSARDAVPVAGHGSHVVTDMFKPGSRDAGALTVPWDDERFRTFVDRLGELQGAEAV